jgi:hypothetical protein
VGSGDERLIVRVRPGRRALPVNVSVSGALIEVDQRLLPGSLIDLQLTCNERVTNVGGFIVRCHVVRLQGTGVRYQGAVQFQQAIPWLVKEGATGYAVPDGELGCCRGEGGRATPDGR